MKITSFFIPELEQQDRLSYALDKIETELGHKPNLVIAAMESTEQNKQLTQQLGLTLSDTPFIACSSCQGVTNQTSVCDGKGNFGIWALDDHDGAYGVGFSEFNDDPHQAAIDALHQALDQADRMGELPDHIWVHMSPGYEELVISTIDEYFGGNAPISGGSSADNQISGEWFCCGNQQLSSNGVAIAVMFPSTKVIHSFQSGYTPTKHTGIVTKSQGRTLIEINHRPAAEVYNEWVEGQLQSALEDKDNTPNILSHTSLIPLGVAVGTFNASDKKIPYYSLVHPETMTKDGALTLFANINEGQEITLMRGSKQSLINRAGRVVHDALRSEDISPESVVGGLVIYCAGCMMTVGEQLPEVSQKVYNAFEQRPFMSIFTFGEQGCFLGGENRHGNLMITSLVFTKRANYE